MRNPLTARNDRIYLTGFMGSGKSTIGPILANTLGYGFVDLDQMIEQAEGMTVKEIFQRHGEPYFRAREKAIIGSLTTRSRIVIALGGGSLMDPQNLQSIIATGILVYLKVSPDEILRRVQRKDDRPLLTTPEGERLSDEEARVRIRQLHSLREPVYELADITVLSDEYRVGVTVDLLMKKLAPFVRT